jgi:hypothetical protein
VRRNQNQSRAIQWQWQVAVTRCAHRGIEQERKGKSLNKKSYRIINIDRKKRRIGLPVQA